MNKARKKLESLYKVSKSAKVGEECTCPSCNTLFIKTNYQQAFCKSKNGTFCKDWYWNNVTPNKRDNRTRISPANARYFQSTIIPNMLEERGFRSLEEMNEYYLDDDGSWDAHQCVVEKCEFCGYVRCECEDL